ncbi:MAG TPA: LCP family protein [Candidatus Pullichristensenella excrementipullorum]|nr:LCP family protein [Candidatus Pullichristensenella excrementipullorum]
MSDRRPPQQPTSSTRYGARPTGYRSSGAQSSGYRSSGARPTGSRPAGYGASGSRPSGARPAGGSRRTPPRRGKRPNGRFYVFLGILLVVIVAVVLLIWQPWASGDDPSVSAFVAPTPVVAGATAAPAMAPSVPDAQQAQGNDAQAQTASPLSELLGSEDTNITGLTEDQMVDVTDLSINTGLSPEWMNILLLGVDQRVQGESCRSDTMIICSINTETSEVKLTSLMRDMAVEFDDLGANNGTYRLNAANYFGGPELTMKTINELLGLNIEKYVIVNFTGFTQICEALGGIEMDITEAEKEQINLNVWSQLQIAYENGWDESNLTDANGYLGPNDYGENIHLNGRQALAYARIRKIDSDWERTNRQRKVLVAMMDKMRGTNMLQLLQLGGSLMQYVETNMTLEEIISIADKVLNSGLEGAETMAVPVTDTYVQETRNNQSMFYDVDWTTNAREVQNFIYY